METIKNWWTTFVAYLIIGFAWVKFTAHMTWLEVVGWWFKAIYYVVGLVVYKPINLFARALLWLSSKVLDLQTRLLVFLFSARAKW